MAGYDASPEDTPLATLMAVAPDVPVHASAAALIAFVSGAAAALSAPFSLTMFVSVACGAVAAVCGFAGVVASSRRGVAGRALAPVGLVLGLGALAVVGLRYLGLDTAIGDDWAPELRELLHSLNALLPPL